MKVSPKNRNIMVANSISFQASLVTILHTFTVKAVLTILSVYSVLYYVVK